MAVVGGLVERVGHAGGNALGRILGQTHGAGDLVGGEEADAVDIARQSVGILAHDVDGIVAVIFVDLGGQAGGDAVALEKEHHFLDGPLLFPGLGDHPRALASHVGHFDQTARRLLDDVERLDAKLLDDALGRGRPHALDQPATQILLNPGHGRRQHRTHLFDRELLAVLGVNGPAPAQLHALAHVDAGHVADDGDLLGAAPSAAGMVDALFRRQLGNGVAVLFIVVGDALDHAAQCVHGV